MLWVLADNHGKKIETAFDSSAEWTTVIDLPAVSLLGVGLVVGLVDLAAVVLVYRSFLYMPTVN